MNSIRYLGVGLLFLLGCQATPYSDEDGRRQGHHHWG